ncbi:MAG: prenyltransferase [Euryarchaeota archaeon]|nr:prenyltransferase [Euryarchaeota archaeon]
MSFKVWMMEIRVPYLLLPIILSIVGGALALYHGSFDVVNFFLFMAVLLLLHITVNTLNDYYDHKTGIDFHTKRTMFNGGTGILQKGLLEPQQVYRAAMGCFIIAAVIGAYVVYRVGLILLPLLILGMIFALFYTQIFARNMLGEISAGLGLGVLPIIGAFMVHGLPLTIDCVILSVAAGILTFNLLLLNEFPDVDADVPGGRRNIVISLGTKKAAKLYSLLTFSVYGILLIFTLMGVLPPLCLIGLATLPIAFKAASLSFTEPNVGDSFFQGQKANVQMILVTQLFVAVGIVASLLLI